LCAYPASLFVTTQGKAALAEVCGSHAKVDLVETPPDGPWAGIINILQRRSDALSLEVAKRIQAERELADFVENAGEGLHRVDGNGVILWANQAELDLLGHQRHEYVGHHITEFHADPQTIAGIEERLHRGQAIRDQAARLRHKDGSIRHVRITSNARIEDGRLVYTRCFTRDETDRVQLLEERRRLLDSAQEHAEVLESVTDGYLHVGPDWRVTFASIGAGHRRRVHGEMVGRVLWDAFPGILGTQFEREFRAAMQSREARVFEAYYEPADTWYENRLFPAGDGLTLYYRDVTAKRQLERQLDSRNRQHAAVAHLGQLALAEHDPCKVLLSAVQEASQAVGVEHCKVLQLQPDGGLFLVAGTGWRDGLVGALTIPAGSESQAGYTLQSGGSVIVTDLGSEQRFHPTPLLMEHGVVSGMGVAIEGHEAPWGVLSVHSRQRRVFNEDDIHFLQSIAHLLASAIERARVEAELRTHRDHLEDMVGKRTAAMQDALRELEAFSYTVSHDLRSPLRAIEGYSRILLRSNPTARPVEEQQMLEVVGDQAIRMGRLIESLLALSRIGRVELARQDLDLSQIATDTLEQLQQASPSRRVTWSIEPGLAARGDAELIRLALGNVLGNAWKFTSRTPEARITLRRAGTAFCVADNGAGFDMAHAGELFQPFHRLHTPDEFEGTGIGLATVQRIINRHGGQVWAEGLKDQGAVFYFSALKR
ncbi:MAG: hypothetical protein QOI63_1629, partial [Thermoplasmata archaeon]|nr:hypothetical protein [Thermoplasmata archaeon]